MQLQLGDTAIRSRYARLTVLVPPEPPRILQGKYHSTTEDSEVKLECVAVGGKPPAEITWVDSNAGVLTQGVNYTVEALSDGQRYTARSVITMTPKQEHHNQTFTCQAQNTADRAYRSASILIEVKYAPKVKLVINKKNSKGKIPEGSDVTISCVADANPSNLTYRWFLDEQQVVGNNSTQLVIRNITRDYNEVILKCVVYNAVGKSEETETLEVTYPPSFRSLPRDAEGELDSAVALACGVDGHPPPEVIWLHHEEDQNIRPLSRSELDSAVALACGGDGHPPPEVIWLHHEEDQNIIYLTRQTQPNTQHLVSPPRSNELSLCLFLN
ncbi:unnamed protein product [Plutella xylostella]|uniref:(diamondback moth) hypothetical protein n=1 Tax=Plutella xylostella TaxID=51655 RepID=A0A8S4ELL7_PLUXY|nr:unnamed protein product [Plutella xylostella]